MAKSFFMIGQEAGFNITTQEGSDQFIGFYNTALEELAAKAGFLPAPEKSRKTGPTKKRNPGGKKKKTRKKRRR